MSVDSRAATDSKLGAGVLKVAGVVVLGAIMSILDITVVSVALPTFQSPAAAPPGRVRRDRGRGRAVGCALRDRAEGVER
jgi:hypothetical protein